MWLISDTSLSASICSLVNQQATAACLTYGQRLTKDNEAGDREKEYNLSWFSEMWQVAEGCRIIAW